jgi:hypothetical protein
MGNQYTSMEATVFLLSSKLSFDTVSNALFRMHIPITEIHVSVNHHACVHVRECGVDLLFPFS